MSKSIEEQTKSLSFSSISAQLSFLLGKTLTIIDASYSNPSQNKAIKDLIRNAFREQESHVANICGITAFFSGTNDVKS